MFLEFCRFEFLSWVIFVVQQDAGGSIRCIWLSCRKPYCIHTFTTKHAHVLSLLFKDYFDAPHGGCSLSGSVLRFEWRDPTASSCISLDWCDSFNGWSNTKSLTELSSLSLHDQVRRAGTICFSLDLNLFQFFFSNSKSWIRNCTSQKNAHQMWVSFKIYSAGIYLNQLKLKHLN